MKAVSEVATVICAVAIASSLVTVIAPSGAAKRILNAVVGVFILCCLIVPIKNAVSGIDFNINIPKLSKAVTASADEAYDKAVLAETKSRLESEITAYLLNKGYKINRAKIKINSKYKTGIFIEAVSIYIYKDNLNSRGEITALIKDKFDTIPVFKVT